MAQPRKQRRSILKKTQQQQPKMGIEIEKYITQKYERWLDYSIYHCTHSGIGDEAVDVLNEVLCQLLEKSEDFILSLLRKKSGIYSELDFYVLRMIKINATSDTSPYKYKYKSLPMDDNVDYQALEIEDMVYEEIDTPAKIIEQTSIIRQALEELNINKRSKQIFEYRFFGETFKDWSGKESRKELYETYQNVLNLIKEKLNGKILF